LIINSCSSVMPAPKSSSLLPAALLAAPLTIIAYSADNPSFNPHDHLTGAKQSDAAGRHRRSVASLAGIEGRQK
jgi:hypothetical protein